MIINKFKFGLVTSFYNMSKHMDAMIQSVVSQTYDNWLWFVTDDGSTDDTKDRLLTYCKKYPKMIYCEQKFKKEMYWQPQRFVSPECYYVVLLDHDDIVNPRLLSTYNKILNDHEYDNIVAISCDYLNYNEDLTYLYNASYASFQGEYSRHYENFNPTSETEWNQNSLCFWGHARAFKNIEGLDFGVNEFNSSANPDCLHYCLLQDLGNILLVKRNLYIQRRSDSVFSMVFGSTPGEWDDFFKIKNIYLERINNPKHKVLDFYENILDEANAFLTSRLNNDAYTKVGLFTINKDRDFTELKKLYYDYDLTINEFRDVDYVIINAGADFDFLETVLGYYKDRKRKEVMVYYFQPHDIKYPEAIAATNEIFTKYKEITSKYAYYYIYNWFYRHFTISF